MLPLFWCLCCFYYFGHDAFVDGAAPYFPVADLTSDDVHTSTSAFIYYLVVTHVFDGVLEMEVGVMAMNGLDERVNANQSGGDEAERAAKKRISRIYGRNLRKV